MPIGNIPMKKVALFTAVAAIFAAMGTAHAAPAEGYYGFGHYTHNNLKASGVSDRFAEDKSANGAGLGMGYRYSENMAVEAGYKQLGKNEYRSVLREHASIKAQAVTVRAIGILPITEQLALEGSLGAAITNTKLESNSPRGTSEESKTTLVLPVIAVGASYALTDELTAFTRYEYTALPKMDNDSVKLSSGSLDVGLRYRF